MLDAWPEQTSRVVGGGRQAQRRGSADTPRQREHYIARSRVKGRRELAAFKGQRFGELRVIASTGARSFAVLVLSSSGLSPASAQLHRLWRAIPPCSSAKQSLDG
jgi:hypothetical protein